MDVQLLEGGMNAREVLDLVRTASDLVQFLRTPPHTGIEWHHEECWNCLGRCATYGCEPRPRPRAA